LPPPDFESGASASFTTPAVWVRNQYKWIMCRFLGVSLLILCCCSCRPREPLVVSVRIETAWAFSVAPITDSERMLVKDEMFRTLRRAYDGFDVRFEEGTSNKRIIRIEDTPVSRSQPVYFGATGITFPASPVSSVRADVMYHVMLTAAACSDAQPCSRTRAELMQGLGRGLGATAAHELGHQSNFRFALDSRCDDCYDGSQTMAPHFFGEKRWSAEAREIMQRVLPPRS
jgi:hypothetical protein